MNLIHDDFLPVRRKSGKKEKIPPWRITESEDPVLSLDAARPDFNGALAQFLIGLLQTAAAPESEEHWIERLENPPAPKILKERFSEYSHAFETESDKGAFMQDFDPLEDGKTEEIFHLLIDSPGDNTIKHNKDHFVKRDRAEKFCEPCAVTALFTLQVNAPSGGQGHRTSLRGGGPLTTLVVLDTNSDWPDERQLWQNLWLNVLDKDRFWREHDQSGNQPHDIFPWLAKTRTSEKGETITPANANFLQMYWGMPRRIRIQRDSLESGVCDLCGAEAPRLIKNYRTKPHGANYEDWRHHLSPYYCKKNKNGKQIPPRLKEGDISYQHWLDYAEGTENRRPAKVISRYRELQERWKDQFRLRAFGYEMDKMKARCYYDKTFPLFMTSKEMREDFFKRVHSVTEASAEFSKYFMHAVKDAWFREKSDKRKKDMPSLKKIFYQKTEKKFFDLLKKAPDKIKAKKAKEEILHEWHGVLKKAVLNLFDHWAERGDIEFADAKRIVQAKQKLKESIQSQKIKDLLQMHVPPKKKKGRLKAETRFYVERS